MALIFRRKWLPRCPLSSFSTSSVLGEVNSFRTDKTNPADHTSADIGRFYTLPIDVSLNKLFKGGGWHTSFVNHCKTFRETCLMVRQPALEIIHYLSNADYSLPINKYLLYGKLGTGKSLVMSHVLHYAFLHGWLIVHMPWVPAWLSLPGEVLKSQTREGFVDLNQKSLEWLIHFKTQNSEILTSNELTIEKDYVWNVRESSKAGDSLLSIVDYGISRGSFSSEVVVALLHEIKCLSRNGKVRTLVLIDGFNALFHNKSKVMIERRNYIPPEKISALAAFVDLTKADWHNGAAVLVSDPLAIIGHRMSEFPFYQLTIKGFEHIFPFVPIEVHNFTDYEFINMLEYYRDRHWLRTKDGDEEIRYLSGRNGYQIMRVCAPL